MNGSDPLSKPIIMTDSACDIPLDVAKQFDIRIMNFSIAVDGKNYTERVDFTPTEFVGMLKESTEIPATAHITMPQFMETYEQLEAEGYTDVIHVTINAQGSNTYNAAIMAKEHFHNSYPNSTLNITIIDSGTYSMGYGYFLCKAMEMAQAGSSPATIIQFLETSLPKIDILLGVFSLGFVKKSGRISAAAAFAGEVMGLRPIIRLKDGTTTIVEKVRGDKKVLPSMIENTKASMRQNSPYCIGYTQPEIADELATLAEQEFGYPAEYIFPLGAAVVSNTGPDGIGIIFLNQ